MSSEGSGFRSAAPGDEPRILALFREVFGFERGEAHWTWQYGASPGGAGVVTLATEGDSVLGCAALMRQDLTHVGRRIPAAQACDGMLSEAYRGEGVYARLAQSNYRMAAERGLDLIIGFPNQRSFPTLLRNLGHRRVLVLRHYQRRLGAGKLLGRLDRLARPAWRLPNRVALGVLDRRSPASATWSVTSGVPEGIDRLLAEYRAQEVIAVWKDVDYLRWRYENHPTHDYRFHTLHLDGEPVSLAVVRIASDRSAICELIDPKRSVPNAARLLRHIVADAGRDRSVQAVEFYGHDISFFDAAFSAAGFRRSVHSPLIMIASAGADHPLADLVPVPGNWTVVYGDTDII